MNAWSSQTHLSCLEGQTQSIPRRYTRAILTSSAPTKWDIPPLLLIRLIAPHLGVEHAPTSLYT